MIDWIIIGLLVLGVLGAVFDNSPVTKRTPAMRAITAAFATFVALRMVQYATM